MRIPWTKAYPAKVKLTALILADHMIAASIFFNSNIAFGAFLQKERNNKIYFYATICISLYIKLKPRGNINIHTDLYLTNKLKKKKNELKTECSVRSEC